MKPGGSPVADLSHARAVVLLACLLLLSACASASQHDLQIFGSQIFRQSIDFSELLTYGRRAKTAYSAESAIRVAYPKTVRVAQPGKTEVVYFIERDDAAKTQIITIRGTANHKNISEDMEFHVREDRKMLIPVHTGFDLDAQAVYKDARPFMKPNYRTYVAGHSLGGAVAAIFAIYAIEDGYKVAKVITFGQPRFTTASGVSKLGFLPILRIVDENDVIPMVPPSTAFDKINGPYEHVGPEVILLEGRNYVYLPSHDATRLDVGEFWRTIGLSDLKDHHMDFYLERIGEKTKSAAQVSYNNREKYIARAGTAQAK
jgi:hypothetical protein